MVESFVEVNGCRVHYRARGANGPAILLVHGLPGHSFSWRHNIDALAANCRVFAIDLPGFGYSAAGPAYDYSFSAAADVIASFANIIGEREICIGALSMGGACALLCAANYPTLVRGMVLAAPVNPFDLHLLRRIRLGALPNFGYGLLRAAQPFAYPLTWLLLRWWLYGRGRPEAGAAEGYAAPLRRPEIARALQRTYAAWNLDSVQTALPRITQPVTLIWGDRDRIVRLPSAYRLAEALNANLHVLPGCGHLAPEECPDHVNSIIRSCLLDGMNASGETLLHRGSQVF